jgi:hypothetical protein
MALQGAGAFRLLQAAGLSAFSRSSGSSWARGLHASSGTQHAAEPAPQPEQPAEPRWSRELGVIRTDWT